MAHRSSTWSPRRRTLPRSPRSRSGEGTPSWPAGPEALLRPERCAVEQHPQPLYGLGRGTRGDRYRPRLLRQSPAPPQVGEGDELVARVLVPGDLLPDGPPRLERGPDPPPQPPGRDGEASGHVGCAGPAQGEQLVGEGRGALPRGVPLEAGPAPASDPLRQPQCSVRTSMAAS